VALAVSVYVKQRTQRSSSIGVRFFMCAPPSIEEQPGECHGVPIDTRSAGSPAAADRHSFHVLSLRSFQDLAYGLTGPLAGLLADRAGYGSVFLIGGTAAAAALLFALFLRTAPGPA
jgi:hypothetical protein